MQGKFVVKKIYFQKMTEQCKFLVFKSSITENSIIPLISPDPDVSIPLNLNVKTDEEIVFGSNYKLNRDIKELLTPSKKSRRAKKYQKSGNPPKPPNSFFIYMRNLISQPEYHNKKVKDRVRNIRDRWKRERNETKDLFEAWQD